MLKYKNMNTALINKNTLLIPGLVTLLLCGIIYFTNHLEERATLRPEIFVVGKGFGYNIVQDNKVLIKQVSIPAVQGSISFSSAEDAEKTAHMVIEKLLKGEDPRISVVELEAMKINIPKANQNTE